MEKRVCVPFVVNETPYCLWDQDLSVHNLRFIKSIEPAYFSHVANVHGAELEGENKQLASIALRTAYGHGLETFFALVCAAVQAPHCIVGWMLKYRNQQLRAIVRKIQNRETVLTRLRLEEITWQTIARVVYPERVGSEESDQQLQQSFSRLWRRFADQFLNDDITSEHNSIKHGLRVRMGGFGMAIGPQKAQGVPAERFHDLGSGEFGSTFYRCKRIAEENSINLSLSHTSLNWNPVALVHALGLISMSIHNVVTLLQALNGVDQAELHSKVPGDEAHFQAAWDRDFDPTKMTVAPEIKETDISPYSRDDVLRSYRKANADSILGGSDKDA